MHRCMRVISWRACAHDIAKEYMFVYRSSTLYNGSFPLSITEIIIIGVMLNCQFFIPGVFLGQILQSLISLPRDSSVTSMHVTSSRMRLHASCDLE